MMARAAAARAGLAGDGRRRVTGLVVTVLCLMLAREIASAIGDNARFASAPGQVPFVVALFVIPLAYALPGPRRWLDRYRWPVLAVQGVLTWVPFAVFGGGWAIGLGGLLAGLVLLMVPGRVAWPLAGLLLAADVTVRAVTGGWFGTPPWLGVVLLIVRTVDRAMVVFGMIRLAQIVGEVQEASGQAAGLAAAGERLRAAAALQAAIGVRLADVTARAAAARQALSGGAAAARGQIAAAGAAARNAVAQARAVAAGLPGLAGLGRPELPPPVPGRSVIGARLAWAVLVTVLSMFAALGFGAILIEHLSVRVEVLAAVSIVLTVAVQLHISGAARRGRRPRAWPVMLALQAVLVSSPAFPFIWAYANFLFPFLAGSVLLLVPGWWRWAGFAAVVAGSSVMSSVLPLRGNVIPPAAQPSIALDYAALYAGTGLVVYGLSWLAGLAAQLEGLRGELAAAAAVEERLRVARDVHDLLGLGLSAAALKADLAGALIGRDDARAAAEMEQMTRICAAARADIRLVTGDGTRLSLAAELQAATAILTSAGIQVYAGAPAGPLPAAAEQVLAPVLREAVTNILRHADAATCTIEAIADAGAAWLRVANDGAPPAGAAGQAHGAGAAGAAGTVGRGSGLANLDARVRAAGGQLTSQQAGGRFELSAQIPLASPAPPARLPWARRQPLLPARLRAGQPGVDHPLPAGHRADRPDEIRGPAVLQQVPGHPGAQRRG